MPWRIGLQFTPIVDFEGKNSNFLFLVIFFRVYFSDKVYAEDELPAEFKLYLPVKQAADQ